MTKIWQKTWWAWINDIVEAYTVWNDYLLDMQLIPYDIQWSQAHTKMLHKIWILSEDEKDNLLSGLSYILQLYNSGDFVIDVNQEDWHTAIESYLIQHCWEVGKKIHTGRSRNDQILVTTRLFTIDKLSQIQDCVMQLIHTFDQKIREVWDTQMPWYTHTQRAMPTTVWTWLWSFRDSLQDDLVLIKAAKKVNNQNPLWSVAWFWEDVFQLDRDFVTGELYFDKTQSNPMYCAYSRGKFEYIVLQSLSHVMMDLGKIASDLVLFSSREFDFFDLPDDFKTWSSVMPQKKNWDIMELVRWNSNLFLWYEYQIREIFKNLFSWYNRDFQLTKEPYLKWIALTQDTVNICTLAIENLSVKKWNLEKACTKELYATREAYELVKNWMNFRDAYKIVGEKYIN